MTKTSLPVLAILAAFAAQACAAPTSDDASSDPTTNDAVAEGEHRHAEAGEASKLSGAFGTAADAPTLAGAASPTGGEMKAGNGYPATLFIKSRNATYDVIAYDFGIERGAHMDLSGSTRQAASPPNLMPLSIVVAHKPGTPSLAQDALSGASLGEIVLSQFEGSGKAVELARFERATIVASHTSAGGDVPQESVTFHSASIRVSKAGNWVKYDAVKNEVSTSLSCGDRLGAYTQSLQTSYPIAKGSTRIDSIDVAVSGQFPNAPSLDMLGFTGALEDGGLCSIAYAAEGTMIPTVRLAVAAPSAATSGPREAITWDACIVAVDSVRFGTRWDGTTEAVQLSAAGLVRTDRSWAWDGKVTETTNGWSFAASTKIASCGDMKK